MATLTPSRNLIQSEEVTFKASVSESLLTRQSATANFISLYQHMSINFVMNGAYRQGSLTTGLDGIFIFPFDAEVIGCSFSNAVNGSTGTTTWDIHKLSTSGTDSGTVLSTKPSINSTAGNNAFGIKIFGTDNTPFSQGGTGITLPTFSTVNFSQGEGLRIDLDGAMTGAQNAKLTIYYRPR